MHSCHPHRDEVAQHLALVPERVAVAVLERVSEVRVSSFVVLVIGRQPASVVPANTGQESIDRIV